MPRDYSKPNPLRDPTFKMSGPSIEVVHQEHVEIEQEVVTDVQVGHEIQTTQTINQQVEVSATYAGDLIDYETFNTDGFKQMTLDTLRGLGQPEEEVQKLYDLIKKESFANIPRAIKYFTPAAAEVMAKRLPAYVSLDINDLPQGFSCAKTPKGEIVLDYDAFAEDELEINQPFALHILRQDINSLAELSLVDERGNYVCNYWAAKPADYADFSLGMCRLVDDGLDEDFKENLTNINRQYFKEPRFKFIYQHYLRYLSDCTKIIGGDFYRRVSAYNPQQFEVLKQLLTNTGSSCHDINKTLDDFEIFWAELEKLCRDRQVDIKKFQANWQVPAGGHPAVYMRRLLYILTAARDLEEQFKALKDLDLGQNGAYYAMSIEDLKVVSAAMNLNYDPVTQGSVEYTDTRNVYRVDWNDLFERCGKHVRGYEFASLYRFAAQQDKSIDINSLQQCFDERSKDADFKRSMFDAFTLILFGVIHQEYLDEKHLLGKTDLELLSKEFIRIAENAIKKETRMTIFRHLQNLFEKDIKLNATALTAVTNILTGLNSAEIESVRDREEPNLKQLLLDKLFKKINTDKHSALKYLYIYSKIANNKFPIDYTIDMADYLAEDAEEVAILYKQDLLILALLLNDNRSRYVKRINGDDVPENLQKIKNILVQAASANPESELMRYAIQHIILAGKFTTNTDKFIEALNIIAALDKDSPFSDVNDILLEYGLYQGAARPLEVTVYMNDLRDPLLGFIIGVAKQEDVLREYIRTKTPDISIEAEEDFSNALNMLSVDDLGSVVTQVLEQADLSRRVIYKTYLANIYKDYKDTQVAQYFTYESREFTRELANRKFKKLHFLQSISDYDELKAKLSDMSGLAEMFKKMLETPYIADNINKFSEVLQKINPDEISRDFLWSLFSLGAENSKVEYLPIFDAVLNLAQGEDISSLCTYIKQLANDGFPVPYIEKFVEIFSEEQFSNKEFLTLRNVFVDNPTDPVLRMLFASSTKYSLGLILKIVSCLPSQDDLLNREKLADFISTVGCLDELPLDTPPRASKYLYILTKLFTQEKDKSILADDYKRIIKSLDGLNDDELANLQLLYTKSNVRFTCLEDGLARVKGKPLDFQALLEDLEKNPFGKRPATLHDKSQVERVINNLFDRVNGSVYPYAYRKQVMESFLFVDSCGNNLKVFSGKSAEELSNQELANEFQKLKENDSKSFEEWLLGLALIREAMYRTSGKYAYSTQIIALIESMLHAGDTLTNIETGQGKSLIDAMHASLLWLGSEHVTVTVPSQVDSARDLAEFGGCFDLLGIKHGNRPLSSTSAFNQFLNDGINFISFSHLGLLDNRARVAGIELLGDENTKASIIINESDDTILNDRVVCRLALTDPDAPSPSQFWIYDEVNDFIDALVETESNQTVTIQDDIDSLRKHLLEVAREKGVNQKQIDYIVKLDDARLWMWMCSSKRVKGLNTADKDDYVISKEKEYKNIDGTMRLTNVVNLVMQDKQISLESQYGEGAMPLLYSRLNRDRQLRSRSKNFVIPRESKTVISSTNRVLIKKFQKRKGVVRGSSATTGSSSEVAYQNEEYGFGATTIPPHQISKMVVHRPIFAKDEEENTKNIKKILNKPSKSRPKLIICGSIAEAHALYQAISVDAQLSQKGLQIFTGRPDEEQEVIQRAASAGMITITTPALGRNKDVRYLRKTGMDVVHTSIQEDRLEIQGNGRTAREGSPGDVYYCINTAKYGNDKEKIKTDLHNANKLARENNHWIHDLLNYLLVQIENSTLDHHEDFFHQDWSGFSKEWEACYQEHIRGTINLDQAKVEFQQELIIGFRSKFNLEVDKNMLDTFMQMKHRKRRHYLECNQDVKISDCMQPELLALRLQGSDRGDHQTRVADLKKSVKNSEHKNFFAAAFADSKNAYWFQTPLTDLMRDKASLRLFREEVRGLENPIDTAKEGVKLLINEYLSANYFINCERKAKARDLLVEIELVTNTADLYKLITQTQLSLAEKDIEENQTRWRSIHFFGKSRLQESLSSAVILIRTLDREINRETLSVSIDGENKHISKFKYDEDFQNTFFKTDKSNARVIHASIQAEEVFEQEEDRMRKTFIPRM